MRAQLGLSAMALVAFGGIVGALPLALLLLPGLQHVFVLGVPLPIVIVAWPPFPLFVAIAFLYSRRAAALEESFRDLVEPP
jgi:hypothetical protein